MYVYVYICMYVCMYSVAAEDQIDHLIITEQKHCKYYQEYIDLTKQWYAN